MSTAASITGKGCESGAAPKGPVQMPTQAADPCSQRPPPPIHCSVSDGLSDGHNASPSARPSCSMVGRHDTRLLENLVKTEKDYHAALVNLLALSRSSTAALSAYGSSLSPSSSRAVLNISESFNAVDDALSAYGRSIDDWQEKLGEIRRLDSDLDTAMRDREILITRLIKISKQKAKNTPAGTSSTKLAVAQAELQACEAHLNQRQHELDEVVRSAVIDGLERRCKALVECGSIWSAKGNEGLATLGDLANTPVPNGDTHPYAGAPRPPFFRVRHDGNGSIDSSTSLAPSQSASQIGLGRPSEDTHFTAASSNVPSQARGSGLASPVSAPYRLDIPPAHSIDDHVLPSGMPATMHEQDDGEEIELNSSSESEADRPLEVHDNPVRQPAVVPVPMPPPSQSALAKDIYGKAVAPVVPTASPSVSPQPAPTTNSSSHIRRPTLQKKRQSSEASQADEGTIRKRSTSFSLFGSIAGIFSTKSKSSASGSKASNGPPSPTKSRGSRLRDVEESPPRRQAPSGSGWQTRTDRNLRQGAAEMVVGSRANDSSSDEDGGRRKKGLFSVRKPERPPPERALNLVTNPQANRKPSTKRKDKQKSSDQTAVEEDDSPGNRRLSRHSSDGALQSRSNSIKRSPSETRGRTQDDATIGRKSSTKAKAHSPSPAPPPPVTKDLPPPQLTLPRATTVSGGKIRKRAPAKHFDDGLGKSGGALLTGAAAANAGSAGPPTSPTYASGNTGLGGIGNSLGRSGTVKSNASAATTAVNPSSVGRATNNGYRRSSLQSDGSFAKSTTESLGRSNSSASHTGSAIRGRGAGPNNLMSIVEGPPGHSRSGSREEPPKLEVVKAPPSLSTATAPNLYLPRADASSPPPPMPPAKNGQTPSKRMSVGETPSRLLLPSELPRGEPRSMNGFPYTERKGSLDAGSRGLVLPSTLSATNLHSPTPIPVASASTSHLPTMGSGNIISRNSSIRSTGTPSALQPPPLRSALRRSPSPAPPAPPQAQGSPASTPSPPVPSSPAPPPVPMKSPKRQSHQLQQMAIPSPKDDPDADSASISSYETGHENLDDSSDAPTVLADKPEPKSGRAPEPAVSTVPEPGTGLMGFVPPPPPPHEEKRGTDISFSTTETDSTSQPNRRKSVRMALPPSVSSTPAATPAALEDTALNWSQGPQPSEARHRRSRVYAEKDIWAEEDSDEGGDYGEARKLLAKATKALESAGDLTKREKRNSHRV